MLPSYPAFSSSTSLRAPIQPTPCRSTAFPRRYASFDVTTGNNGSSLAHRARCVPRLERASLGMASRNTFAFGFSGRASSKPCALQEEAREWVATVAELPSAASAAPAPSVALLAKAARAQIVKTAHPSAARRPILRPSPGADATEAARCH